jgi:hypothetical protein
LASAAIDPDHATAARAGLAAGYALGIVRRERWGVTGNCHRGNIGTFRALLCIYLGASADGRRWMSDGTRTLERVSVRRVALLWASAAAGILGLLVSAAVL